MKLNTFIEKIVTGYPKLTVVLFTLIAVLAFLLLPGLKQDPSPYLLPPTHESRVNLERLRETYSGSRDSIIILLEASGTVFKKSTLERIRHITEDVEKIHILTEKDLNKLKSFAEGAEEGIKKNLLMFVEHYMDEDGWQYLDEAREIISYQDELNEFFLPLYEDIAGKLNPVIEVTSLSNTDNILGRNGELDVSPIFEEIPESDVELAEIRNSVHSNALFEKFLFTTEDTYTSILIETNLSDDDVEGKYLIYEKIKKIIEEDYPGNEAHYIAGIPVVTAALGKVMQQDTKRLFPIVISLVVLCLFLTFRMVKGILVPLSVVILSLVVTLSLKVLFDIPMNIITTTLPVFILSIGVADGIHMFSEYRDQLIKGYDKTDAVRRMLKHLTLPIIMTSLTTATAFWSISMTEIIQMKHFGIFVAAGTLIAMIYSLFFIPALLLILPEGVSQEKINNSGFEIKYTGILKKVTLYFTGRSGFVTVTFIMIFILSVFGASKVVVDNNNVGYFMKNSDIYKSSEKLNAKAAGSSVLNFLVKSTSTEEEPFKNPERLNVLKDLSGYIENLEGVGKVLGLPDIIQRINFVLNDENEEYNNLPELNNKKTYSGRNLISQYLLLYENGGGDAISDYTDDDYRNLNISTVLQTNSSNKMAEIIEKVERYAAEKFPSDMILSVSGTSHVSVAATEEIVTGQIVSLAVSLAIVFIMLLLTFRSFYYGLIAMAPLVTTITVNFGIMGFFSIPLDIGTAIISSIVIGIGVDYSIHYISRFREYYENGTEFTDALLLAVSHSGKAIVSNAFTVGLGFIALLFSDLTPLIIMGWMITVTMIVSSLSTLIMIPALFSLTKEIKTRLPELEVTKQIKIKKAA